MTYYKRRTNRCFIVDRVAGKYPAAAEWEHSHSEERTPAAVAVYMCVRRHDGKQWETNRRQRQATPSDVMADQRRQSMAGIHSRFLFLSKCLSMRHLLLT